MGRVPLSAPDSPPFCNLPVGVFLLNPSTCFRSFRPLLLLRWMPFALEDVRAFFRFSSFSRSPLCRRHFFVGFERPCTECLPLFPSDRASYSFFLVFFPLSPGFPDPFRRSIATFASSALRLPFHGGLLISPPVLTSSSPRFFYSPNTLMVL